MPEYPEKQFFNTLNEFMEELKQTFPEEASLHDRRFKRNTKSVRDIVDLLHPHADEIRDRNDRLFDSSIELLPGIEFSTMWNQPDITEMTKSAIWGYLQMLLLMGDFIITPTKVMQTDRMSAFLKTLSENLPETVSTPHTNIHGNAPSKTHPATNDQSSSNETSVFEKMANELMSEINIPENVNAENPIEIFQSLIQNNGGLMKILSKFQNKLSGVMESQDFDQNNLQFELKKLMDKFLNMSKDTPGVPPEMTSMIESVMNLQNNDSSEPPDLSKIFKSLTENNNLPPETASTINALSKLASSMTGSNAANVPNVQSLLGMLTGGSNDLPDIADIEANIRKEERQQFRARQRQRAPDKNPKDNKRTELQKRLQLKARQGGANESAGDNP